MAKKKKKAERQIPVVEESGPAPAAVETAPAAVETEPATPEAPAASAATSPGKGKTYRECKNCTWKGVVAGRTRRCPNCGTTFKKDGAPKRAAKRGGSRALAAQPLVVASSGKETSNTVSFIRAAKQIGLNNARAIIEAMEGE